MRHGQKHLAGIVMLGVVSLAMWGYDSNNVQLQKDVETRVADLHQVYTQYSVDRRDMAAANENLKLPMLTFDQRHVLRIQISKDLDSIQAESTTLLGDINYLQNNWGLLTQVERDFVDLVNKDLQT